MKKRLVPILFLMILFFSCLTFVACTKEPQIFTVTFDSNGGSEVASQTVLENQPLVLPTEPTKTDYKFIGWFAEGEIWKADRIVSQDETLQAKWELITYEITFDTQGGKKIKPQTVNIHAHYVLPVPEKMNYIFKGWKRDDIFFTNEVELTEDVTLVAQWQSVDDFFTYTATDEAVTVTAYIGTEADVIVPAKINDLPVSDIADGVFAYNTAIQSVAFDGSFRNYAKKMFAGCTSLKKLTIGASFDKDLYYLFGDYIGSIPESFTEIEFAANSPDNTFSLFLDKEAVCNHTVTLVIPDGTTKIAAGQFRDYLLESVSLPKSLTEIGDNAFYRCTELTSISLPDSITKIGAYAFDSCTKLNEVQLGNGVTNILPEAFARCTALTNITLPQSITSLGKGVFEGCTSLTDVTFANGISALPDKLFGGCTSLADVVLPESLTDIGEEAFASCSALTEILLPNDVTRIGKKAFFACTKLAEIVLPTATESIASETFASCSALVRVTLPNTLIEIGEKAFFACDALTTINLPDGLTTIGTQAFYGCSVLKTVHLPESLTNVGKDIFPASLLTEKDGLYYLDDWLVDVVDKNLTAANVQEGTVGIGTNAFASCVFLSEITLPGTITRIGDRAFYGCANLSAIVLPDGVEVIGEEAFYGCSNLRTIALSADITSIGKGAFQSCTALTAVVLPEHVTSIKDYTFADCGSLAEITLPATLKSIGLCAFSHCSALPSILLPESLTSIGGRAFWGCTKLAKIYYYGTEKTWNALQINAWDNGVVTGTARSYYSQYFPFRNGNYWHYDKDGATILDW